MPTVPMRRPSRRALIPALLVALAVPVAGAAPASAQTEVSGGVAAAGATPAAPVAVPHTLRRGARGARVRRLQRALRLKADGVYGRRTARAVKAFQRRRGLRADGVARAATLRALGLVKASAPASFAAIDPDVRSALAKIADCESGGDPNAISSSGRYRGKYQFDRATWRTVGGKGDPAAASEAEQDWRAAALYEREGAKPWPVCGR